MAVLSIALKMSQLIMFLLNFSHPITDMQFSQICELLDGVSIETINVKTYFDDQLPFASQVEALLEEVPLTADQWQSEPIAVVLPAFNFITAVLLAELHGRMGYFPPIVRTRPAAGAVLRQFEVAELIDLQSVREVARMKR